MQNALLPPPAVLRLLAHEVRWKLLILLARSDYRVQELTLALQLPQNLVSYHLQQLRKGALVTERRSSADERSIYYSLDVDHFQALYLAAGEAVHPAITVTALPSKVQSVLAQRVPLRVLFLCTHNSARSQMAEVLLRHLSHGAIEAYSAGSDPAPHIHPLAIQAMEAIGVTMHEQYPKHFARYQGQHFDAIVTVCDRVHEVCPTFPDDPKRIHWSFPDPALMKESEQAQYQAFERTSLQLATRIRILITLLEREKGYRA